MIADALLTYLTTLGLLSYRANTTGGNASANFMPEAPNTWITLYEYQAPPSDAALGYDKQAIQVRVRGEGVDSRDTEATAKLLYEALHGIGDVTLPGGAYLINSVAQQAPFSMGIDAQQRALYAFNIYTEVRANPTHRE
jgi:hypothetical protein